MKIKNKVVLTFFNSKFRLHIFIYKLNQLLTGNTNNSINRLQIINATISHD